jgi:ketosteroid isomerase-like protein
MTTTETTTVAELLALEEQRCRLINQQDYDGLAAMLSDDLIHVHANGRRQDKAVYLADVSSRPRQTERKDLQVVVHGDAAVMTGLLINTPLGQTPDPAAQPLTAMQVWVRDGATWKQAAFQATRMS